MGSSRITYAQLLETNNLIQANADETYWLCVTRTVQELKLFPVPAYMMLSYMMAYYRYPSLLRKIEQRMSAEEIGDRARNAGIKIQIPSMGWALPGFYLLGREWLIIARPDPAAGRPRGPGLRDGLLEALPACPGIATTATSPTRNSAIAASSCRSGGSGLPRRHVRLQGMATNCTRRRRPSWRRRRNTAF